MLIMEEVSRSIIPNRFCFSFSTKYCPVIYFTYDHVSRFNKSLYRKGMQILFIVLSLFVSVAIFMFPDVYVYLSFV